MNVLTHLGCLMLGGCIGIAALAVVSASRGEIIPCKHCKHSKIERHTGDAVLTCWLYSIGHVVPPDHYCSFGEEK